MVTAPASTGKNGNRTPWSVGTRAMIIAVEAPGGCRAWASRMSTKARATAPPAATAGRSPNTVTLANADSVPRNCPAITFHDRAMPRSGSENSTTADAASDATNRGR